MTCIVVVVVVILFMEHLNFSSLATSEKQSQKKGKIPLLFDAYSYLCSTTMDWHVRQLAMDIGENIQAEKKIKHDQL